MATPTNCRVGNPPHDLFIVYENLVSNAASVAKSPKRQTVQLISLEQWVKTVFVSNTFIYIWNFYQQVCTKSGEKFLQNSNNNVDKNLQMNNKHALFFCPIFQHYHVII